MKLMLFILAIVGIGLTSIAVANWSASPSIAWCLGYFTAGLFAFIDAKVCAKK
jgi:hypothetical protein